jgi:hypothetical protein
MPPNGLAQTLQRGADGTCRHTCRLTTSDERTLHVGPLGEPEARALAAFLLNRTEEPPADGPWRCAVAGGVRVVSLERIA